MKKKKEKTNKDLFQTVKSLAKDPTNLAKNLSETAGGSQIPDPSNIPGFGDETMTGATIDAWERQKIGKELKAYKKKHKNKNLK